MTNKNFSLDEALSIKNKFSITTFHLSRIETKLDLELINTTDEVPSELIEDLKKIEIINKVVDTIKILERE